MGDLAFKPMSLTELDSAIAELSYPALERRLSSMRMANLIEARPSRGTRIPYAVTGVGAARGRPDRRRQPLRAAPPGRGGRADHPERHRGGFHARDAAGRARERDQRPVPAGGRGSAGPAPAGGGGGDGRARRGRRLRGRPAVRARRLRGRLHHQLVQRNRRGPAGAAAVRRRHSARRRPRAGPPPGADRRASLRRAQPGRARPFRRGRGPAPRRSAPAAGRGSCAARSRRTSS